MRGRIVLTHEDDSIFINVRCYNCSDRIINMFKFFDYYQRNGLKMRDRSVCFSVSDVFDTLLTSEEFKEKCDCEGADIEDTNNVCTFRKTRENIIVGIDLNHQDTIDVIYDDIDGHEKKTYPFTELEFAVYYARQLSMKVNAKFRSQNRVFIKKGNEYYNPDKKWSSGVGISWTTEEKYQLMN